MTAPLNLVAEDVHISYRSYLDPQVDLRERLKRGRDARRRHVTVNAVKGVSFELRAGESIGLIGHNGAGKSTLLLGLAGLLPVEQGVVLARSRPTLLGVASVLNVALSGRRNIEIGCLAMGMPKHEIEARMDELIEFAGLEDAIDLPLKAYSSGMRARLSFTVATVETPEVLLIDEALAVGDADFRTKATQRLEEIRGAAGSVVVVSHNMAEVERMCDRVIWLEQGNVVRDGSSRRLIRLYGLTRSDPELMASLLDDHDDGYGPLRPMTLQQLDEHRYLSAQVEPWEIPARSVIGGFPESVPAPHALVTDAVSEAEADALRTVHRNTSRGAHRTEGALLRDWLVDPATGVVLAEWPSETDARQSIVLQETLPPTVVDDDGRWRTEGDHLWVDRIEPHIDEVEPVVYCWSRWPDDPLHWWNDVASRAFLAMTDDRMAGARMLVPELRPWQAEALAAIGVPEDRLRFPPADTASLLRFPKMYFPGALTFGKREEISLDGAVFAAAEAARASVLDEDLTPTRRRLFVPRPAGAGRDVTNAEALDALLESLGFEQLPEDASFADSVAAFAGAEVIVAPSGGTLFGGLFAAKGTPVIELQPSTFPLTTGRAISSLAGLQHEVLVCPAVGPGAERPALAVRDDIEVPVELLASMLTAVLSR